MPLILLGDVVLGVLLQIAHLAGGGDALGDLGAARRLERGQLGAELLEPLCRDRFADAAVVGAHTVTVSCSGW